jgi:putative oxidoreductase
MSATTATRPGMTTLIGDLRSTRAHRHLIILRVIAGVPLLGIGLMHVFMPDGAMRPLVEAAGLPAAALLSPLAVAAEIVAGVSLLFGIFARLGAIIAIPTMLVALYSHFAIEQWPNPDGPPPDALPIVIIACSAYVLWRGAGRWSVDNRSGDRAERARG